MTAVASPPSFHQPVPRSAWTNGSASMHAQMTPDEVSRLLMPPRSKSQSAIPTTTNNIPNQISLQKPQQQIQQQPPPRPSSSASTSSSISTNSSTGTMPGSNSTSTPASSNPSPNNSEPNTPINSATSTINGGPSWGAGKRKAARNGVGGRENNMKNSGNASSALNAAIGNSGAGSFLMLLPLNGTFERKVIPLPYYPDVLRIGRQTNAKTVPTQSNGYFDSKVLSRQHAEVWAEKGSGRVYIRDVKSSNGTFVNGTRLSPENRDSEPHEIRAEDILELGIDIVGEDNKTIVHHKVAARVQHAGFHQNQGGGNNAGSFDLNFGDIDPSVGGGLMAPPLNHVQTVSGVQGRGRSNSQTSRGGPMAFLPNGILGMQRQGGQMMAGMPVTIEAIAKRLTFEMQQARQQQTELKRAHDAFDAFISVATKPQPEEAKEGSENLVNGETSAESQNPESESSKGANEENGMELPMPIEQIESLTSIKFPTKPPSQILSLVAVLADTKRDLEAKSLRVKELEDCLLKERSARELAEVRIEKLELATQSLKTKAEEDDIIPESAEEKDGLRGLVPDVPDAGEAMEKAVSPEPVAVDNEMQLKLDKFMADLTAAQAEIESLKHTLQKSESEKSSAQKSFAQLIEEKQQEEAARIRAEKALEKAQKEYKKREKDLQKTANGDVKAIPNGVDKSKSLDDVTTTASSKMARGEVVALQRAAPYASILGVVIVGVSLMAVLNSWGKGEKP
ncbi:hypothetical protein ABW19_dt0206991 [Dactylella cylindrospora]|nr:hypothetical protein ABW19_dt0206991 [Dactylella cylindrospora]